MPKKKLPEPLVGWKSDDDWSWETESEHKICDNTAGCMFFNPTPAALCPLPRLPRKGERVECRIVPAKKKRKPKPIEPVYSKVDGAIQRLEMEEKEKRERARKRNAKKKAAETTPISWVRGYGHNGTAVTATVVPSKKKKARKK